jgi:hypothetical protein
LNDAFRTSAAALPAELVIDPGTRAFFDSVTTT